MTGLRTPSRRMLFRRRLYREAAATKKSLTPFISRGRGRFLPPGDQNRPDLARRGGVWDFLTGRTGRSAAGRAGSSPTGRSGRSPTRRAGRAAYGREAPPAIGRAGRWTHFLPVVTAAALAAAYVIASPPSLDLAAHLFRAQLFGREPFGIWNNYWYSGHHIVGYSLLFPAASWLLTPQLAAALAATGTAALFAPLARRHFGEDAWLGATVFAAATAVNLFTGRLAFAFGALPAMAAIVALDRRRTGLACALAVISALSSPVAALFVALVGASYALGALVGSSYALGASWSRRRPVAAIPGLAVAVAALAPVGALAVAFPEGGTEPFAFNAFLPILLLGIGALLAIPRERTVLRAGVLLYTLGLTASYLVPTAVGSNAGRLGTWIAAPLAALLWWRPTNGAGPGWRRDKVLLAVLAAPLLYLQWHDPVRDLATASSDPSNSVGYYRPLLRFLERQSGPPFRVEIPFTSFHWEAYAVASRFPIARGWERQLDIKDNPLFYSGRLTAARYERWLHANAVRFVAVANAPLDYAGRAEAHLIARGLSYLKPVMRSAQWRVYAVKNPTPIAQGAATMTALGPDWVTLRAQHAGRVFLHIHFTPYWAITRGAGCVEPAGAFTGLVLRRPGAITLGIDFSLGRIGATSPRCT